MSHHPLVELVRALLRLIAEDWPIDAVASLLKTGLVPVPRDRADLFENYLLAHGIEGWDTWSAKGDWQYLRRLVGADEDAAPPSSREEQMLARVNRVRRVILELLSRSQEAEDRRQETEGRRQKAEDRRQKTEGRRQKSADGRQETEDGRQPPTPLGLPAGSALLGGLQWAEWLFDAIERLKVPRRILRWQKAAELRAGAAGLEEAQQHKLVWNLLTQLLDDLVGGLGDEPMTVQQFQATIEAGLEAFSLPLIPPVVDQVVVGSVDRSRQPDITAAFVLGFNEGLFPHRPVADVLLGDQDRDVLQQIDETCDLMTSRQQTLRRAAAGLHRE